MEADLESLQETRKRIFRKAAIIVTVVLVCTGLPAAWYGPPLYSRFQQHRLVEKARDATARSDFAGAAGSLHRVLALNPDNIEASRLLANLGDQLGAREAVVLHRRVCQLRPNSFDDAFAWASAALKFGYLKDAESAVAILKKTAPSDPRTFAMAGKFAAASGEIKEANDDFAQAIAGDPSNVDYQLASATNALKLPDAAASKAALDKLVQLSSDPQVGLAAVRARANEAFKRDQINIALPLAKQVATNPRATFQDRIAYLAGLHASNQPLFPTYLAEVQSAAEKSPSDVAALISWMNSNNLSMVASPWIDTLPHEIISKPPVSNEVAAAYMLMLEWKKLLAFVSHGDWDESDFIREAFAARALRETGDDAGSEAHWNAALGLASKRPARLPILERIASKWGWNKELADILWLIVGTAENPRPALDLLAGYYTRTGDTRQLNRVWNKKVEVDPDDVSARDNLTRTSLLIGLRSDDVMKSAAALAEKNPSDPEIASTYALALHFQGRAAKGLDALRPLTSDQLSLPPVAAAYGVLLAESGSSSAAKYLAIAQNAQLPPEEHTLVIAALNPGTPPPALPAQQSSVPRPVFVEPSPFKYVLHPAAEATPFKYVFHPDVPLAAGTTEALSTLPAAHSKPTPAPSPSSTHPTE